MEAIETFELPAENAIPITEKRCYTVEDLQIILGISRGTVYKLLEQQEFRWFKIGLRTSITDIRSLIKTVTLFFDKIRAGLVTGGTGSTLDVAEYDFSAYICFSAVISVNAEVVSVKEGSFMIPIAYTMELHFLRNGSRILA